MLTIFYVPCFVFRYVDMATATTQYCNICDHDNESKIKKQTVDEMISKEQHLQVQLRKVLVAMETKRTDFDNIRQDVKKVKKIC
jgi:secreted Zn-dependent insulinase-like peptidase